MQTDAPFPERALVDLCLKAEEHEVHTEGMVRVAHPGHGMGVEFPSRTPEQRAQVGNLIDFLRNCPATMLELIISPRALVADLTQFETGRSRRRKSPAKRWKIRCSNCCGVAPRCSRKISFLNCSISVVPKKPPPSLSHPISILSIGSIRHVSGAAFRARHTKPPAAGQWAGILVAERAGGRFGRRGAEGYAGGFGSGLIAKNRRTRAPSLTRALQLFVVCSTPIASTA